MPVGKQVLPPALQHSAHQNSGSSESRHPLQGSFVVLPLPRAASAVPNVMTEATSSPNSTCRTTATLYFMSTSNQG